MTVVASRQDMVRGEVDLVIGSLDGEESYLFGRILGLEIDSRCRIYVSDADMGSVRAYDSAGEFVFQLGRVGQGPLEYRSAPGAVAILSDGRLWIVSVGDDLLRADPDRDEVATSLERVPVEGAGEWTASGPVGIDAEGYLTLSAANGVDRHHRRRISQLTSRTVSKSHPWTLRPNYPDMGWRLPPGTMSDPRVSRYVDLAGLHSLYGAVGPPPYGTEWRLAYAPDGRIATAVTTEYRVDVRDSQLRPLIVVTRAEDGPRITPAERRMAMELILGERRRKAERNAFGYPYGAGDIPERKPPIRHIWFDRDNRLWVERYLADEPVRQGADVYDPAGRFLFSADWPRGVDFELGAIRGGTGLGLMTDELGIQRVARVRFGDGARDGEDMSDGG